MPNTDQTWVLKPHTKAKHEILREYLKAWFPIMSPQDGRIVYMDGFAGPGTYSKGEDGSPLIAIQTAKEHMLNSRFNQIFFWFIEKDPKTCNKLKQVLAAKFPDLQNNPNDDILYSVINEPFSDHVTKKLNDLKQARQELAPTFALLDPFGFSELPMSLVSDMLKRDKCEVLITFMAGFVNRFHDELRESALNKLFGTSEWKRAESESTPKKKLQFYLDLYIQQLKNKGGAKFVTTFEMLDENNRTIYYLVYGTKHIKGTEVIKRAMQKVSQGNTYLFSDRTHPDQMFLFDEAHDLTILANYIFQHFIGKSPSLLQIKEFVAEKPQIFKKSVLKHLEQTGRIIDVSPRKRKFTYPHDYCQIKFTPEP